MRKIFRIFTLVLMLTVLLSLSVSAAEETESTEEAVSFDFIGYVEGTVIPAAVAVVSSAVLLYIACLPLIRSVKGAVNLIKGSKKNFDDATKKVEDNDKERRELLSELKEMKEENRGLALQMQAIQGKLDEIEKIEKIGFGATSELVKNGAARKIGKVGNDEGKI